MNVPVSWAEILMGEVNKSWEEIVRQLRKEADPRRRKELERELNAALERAGFKKFSAGLHQSSSERTEDE